MITPLLEKLIHQGKAEYQNFNTGLSAFCVLPVPKNCWIVIESIHFYSPNCAIEQVPFGHYVASFNSEHARYDYVFRKNITTTNFLGGVVAANWAQVANGERLDCYQTHPSNVIVRIIGQQDSQSWVSLDYSAVGQIGKEPAPPQGFLGLNVLKQAEISTGDSLQPQSAEYNAIGNTVAGYSKQITGGIVANQSLLPVPGTDLDYPLLNIGYVIIKSAFSSRNG